MKIKHFVRFAIQVSILLFLFPQIMTSQKFVKAQKTGSAKCPSGSFFDPIDGGTCWSCPSNYKRTIYSVKGGKACERSAETIYTKATKHGRGTGILGTDCKSGQFWDPNGNCYSCPRGYSRTTSSVTGSKACSKKVKASHTKASKKGSSTCPSNDFYDLTDGGSCWQCPNGYNRTVFPVKSNKACEANPHEAFLNKHRLDSPTEILQYIEKQYGPIVEVILSQLSSLPEAAIDEFNRSRLNKDIDGMISAIQGKSLAVQVGESSNKYAVENGNDEPYEIVNNGAIECEDNTIFRSLSIGVGMDASVFVAGALEGGVIFNLCGGGRSSAALYGSAAYGIGTSAGADANLLMGLWTSNLDKVAGDAWGFTFAVARGAGASISFWWGYSDWVRDEAPFLGFTVGPQLGYGLEFAEYSRSTTAVHQY